MAAGYPWELREEAKGKGRRGLGLLPDPPSFRNLQLDWGWVGTRFAATGAEETFVCVCVLTRGGLNDPQLASGKLSV